MPRYEYKIYAKSDGGYNVREKFLNSRIHHLQSKKGGEDQDKFYISVLELLDFASWPTGFVENNCEFFLKEFYNSNGKSGWSEKTVFNLLLRLGRKQTFILDFIASVKSKHGGKKI